MEMGESDDLDRLLERMEREERDQSSDSDMETEPSCRQGRGRGRGRGRRRVLQIEPIHTCIYFKHELSI